jgi:hypothetical protein
MSFVVPLDWNEGALLAVTSQASRTNWKVCGKTRKQNPGQKSSAPTNKQACIIKSYLPHLPLWPALTNNQNMHKK